jgi:purine-binding chemotaxis protein CheW
VACEIAFEYYGGEETILTTSSKNRAIQRAIAQESRPERETKDHDSMTEIPPPCQGMSSGSETMMDRDANSPHGTDPNQIVLFTLDGQRYALRLDAVERVVRAAAVTPVPETPAFVLGLVNLAGRLLPVFSFRRCLGLPDRPLRPVDKFVIVRTSQFKLALLVDEVQGLSVVNAVQTVAVEDALPVGECRVQGLVKLDGDVILIYDLEKLISGEERDRILQMKATGEMWS